MNYTLENIHTSRSYEALRRNGFTDIDVVAYYGTPISDRATMIKQIKFKKDIVLVAPTPRATENRNTQMCTVDIDTVREMALEHMEKDWTYKGQTFNMKQLGWSFAFNERKRALGLCSYRSKTIYLSQWFIDHNTREMKMWINTMVHEIAHAINGQLGGRGHDYQWRNIFVSFGGNGERTSGDAEFTNLLENPISKYTLVCPNGHTRPSYKIKRRGTSCGKCNEEHGMKGYQERFKMKQIKNY
jgi:hypothetical protein